MSIEWKRVGIISDGEGGKAEVRLGDMVELLPTHPEKPEGESRKYLSHDQARLSKNFLELDGPYKVARIGLWPCGNFNLYLEMPRGQEPGIAAREFRRAR